MLTNWTGGPLGAGTEFAEPGNWDAGVPNSGLDAAFATNATVHLDATEFTKDFFVSLDIVAVHLNAHTLSSELVTVGSSGNDPTMSLVGGNKNTSTWSTKGITVGAASSSPVLNVLSGSNVFTDGGDLIIGTPGLPGPGDEYSGEVKIEHSKVDLRSGTGDGDLYSNGGKLTIGGGKLFSRDGILGGALVSSANLYSVATKEVKWDLARDLTIGEEKPSILSLASAGVVPASIITQRNVC